MSENQIMIQINDYIHTLLLPVRVVDICNGSYLLDHDQHPRLLFKSHSVISRGELSLHSSKGASSRSCLQGICVVPKHNVCYRLAGLRRSPHRRLAGQLYGTLPTDSMESQSCVQMRSRRELYQQLRFCWRRLPSSRSETRRRASLR